MKNNYLFLTLFLLIVNGLFGQIRTNSIDFDNLDKRIELYQETMGSLQSIMIKTKSGKLIKRIDIDNEFDPYTFQEFYIGERNYAIIGGRYKFLIINVSSNIIIGPFRCCCRVEAEDAQTGVLYAYKIIQNGQYLIVSALDNGLTCYNLSDLYNPKEVDFFKSDSRYDSGKYIFIDKRKENIYNGISASCGNYNKIIDFEILFQGYKLDLNNENGLKYEISENQIMTLHQLDNESNITDLLIDLKNGKILEK